MAGKKGGGAWKVAYADFVTAMMAFFLVMWISAMDQKIKRAVSYYFMDPLGASRKPGRSGAVSEDNNNGSVPNNENVALGRGRTSYQKRTEFSASTKAVSDFVHADKAANEYWKAQIVKCRTKAAASPEVKNGSRSADDAARDELARQLKDEFSRNAPPAVSGVYQDLLFSALTEINWTELAEDLLSN